MVIKGKEATLSKAVQAPAPVSPNLFRSPLDVEIPTLLIDKIKTRCP
jgi:hypothetical protein